MMNKKAIAAFAAGATLFAGFAMATPAMAATNPCKGQSKEWCIVQIQTAQANYNAALADLNNKDTGKQALYDKAVAAYEDAKTKASEADAAQKKAFSDYEDAYLNSSKNKDVLFATYTLAKDTNAKAQAALTAAKTAFDKAVDALTAAKSEVTRTNGVWVQTQRDYADAYPYVPTLEEQQKQAIADVYAAAQKVDETNHVFAHAREVFVNAYGKMKAAKAELVEAKAQLDAAQLALDDFEASGVKDETKHEHLVVLRDRAKANRDRVKNTVIAILTSPEYVNAKAAVDRATADHDRAVKAYEAAYNHAVELNVNPDLLPKITLVDPASDAFPELSEAKKIYDDALSGKFGAAAQKAVQKADAKAKAEAGKNAPAAGANGAAAGANGAAAGKAGAAAGAAKGELAGMGAKGGHGKGKAGEQLGNAGVGVALTALAASMLAGMGAAVRKMRH